MESDRIAANEGVQLIWLCCRRATSPKFTGTLMRVGLKRAPSPSQGENGHVGFHCSAHRFVCHPSSLRSRTHQVRNVHHHRYHAGGARFPAVPLTQNATAGASHGGTNLTTSTPTANPLELTRLRRPVFAWLRICDKKTPKPFPHARFRTDGKKSASRVDDQGGRIGWHRVVREVFVHELENAPAKGSWRGETIGHDADLNSVRTAAEIGPVLPRVVKR